jgi:holo-[acyl-carrier protein] synthase
MAREAKSLQRRSGVKSAKGTAILGLGSDIVEIGRIAAAYQAHGRRFLRRLFTEEECAYCFAHVAPFPHLAARFCAKEAVSKALGTGFGRLLAWEEIEIARTSSGKPEVHLSPSARERFGSPLLLLTMSHCRDYAMATALHCASD